MTLVGFRQASSPGRHCLVLVIRRALAKTSGLSGSRWNEGAACWGSRPQCGISMELRLMRKRGCAPSSFLLSRGSGNVIGCPAKEGVDIVHTLYMGGRLHLQIGPLLELRVLSSSCIQTFCAT